jgi:hypothetical protein
MSAERWWMSAERWWMSAERWWMSAERWWMSAERWWAQRCVASRNCTAASTMMPMKPISM